MNSPLVHLTEETFENEVLKSEIPVLVDFWAPWCAPCRMIGPVVEQLAGEYDGRLKVAKLNTDEYPELAQQFRIFSIPTLLLFAGGKVVDTLTGAVPKPHLKSFLDAALEHKVTVL